MTLSVNTRIGRYEVRALLGKGGMGEVYLAYDTSLRRQVAIKMLPAEFTKNRVRLNRFEREAYAASGLNHPNILTIHEIGEHEGLQYMATEYVEGESLRQLMSRTRMDLREMLGLATQVAEALSAAHEAGIVHRDIKPENIMVRLRDGYVKVLDFGLAKLGDETLAADSDPEAPTRTKVVNTEPGMVMGTASYMSPEQARGLKVDPRTDIWSLGAVLYEMVAGRLPFEGATTTDVLSMILHHEPPSLLLYRSNVPAELERIVEKALTKQRDERYQLARELSVDLKRLRQRLDMEAELERSVTPEEMAQRTGGLVTTGAGAATMSGTTRGTVTPSTEPSTGHAVSSAEYVVGEIKRHKLGVVLASFVIATVLAVFAYYSYSNSRSATINSVAVLPFANLSGDPNMDYLSDGLSESLINNLSQLPALKVISRNSAFKYKGQEIEAQEVAQALGVQAIVTGRVAQRGGQLQVSAELVDVRDKTQMWGEQFNRKATDLLQVQAEISQHIAEKLRLRLTSAEQQQLVKELKANPQAYELVLKGRFHAGKVTPEGLKQAVEYYHQALTVDPNYALAYAWLAAAYQNLAANGILDPKEALPKAEAAAKKALELDERLAEAHSALAGIKRNAWDWIGAEREYERAIELNSNLAAARSGYSSYLSIMGRHEEAIAEAKQALELDPLRLGNNVTVGYALCDARQYDQAIEQLRKTVELDRNFGLARFVLGYTYAAKGQNTQAITEYQEARKLTGEESNLQCYLGYALAKAGRRGEAEAILKQLETTKEYVSAAELAILYIGLDEKEKALSALERAYAAHDLQLQNLNVDPHYDGLRAEPRFQDLIRKVGLPQKESSA